MGQACWNTGPEAPEIVVPPREPREPQSEEPWWTNAKLSGPRMGSASPKKSSISDMESPGRTLGGAGARSQASADELRQKRLERFG
mmetsp:Transcript_10986/g.24051  ORF Transcript_10986/g.24051 Transcript_10986/m.24051 type:complete len:86 (-) Transcript_10986:9-266(-)